MQRSCATKGGRNPSAGDLLASVVSHIGREGFEEALLHQLQASIRADHLAIFLVDPKLEVLDWRVADKNDRRATLHTTSIFIRHIWPRDPQLLGVDLSKVTRVGLSHRRAVQIVDREYRDLCYSQPGVVDRLMFYGRSERGTILMGAYRKRASAPFSLHDFSVAHDSAALLLAACDRHLSLSRNRPADTAQATRTDESVLSNRERQVADLIATGATSRAIADALRISFQTVLTYRKRIYQKLGVATQGAFLAKRYGSLQ